MIVEAIDKKVKDRNVFLDMREKSWDAKLEKYTLDEPKEVDILGKEIKADIKKHVNILPIDFAIEALTMLGDAPCIMYDDNGMFAVTSDGFQKVVVGRQRIDGTLTVLVEKKMWKKNIREALKFYLSDK